MIILLFLLCGLSGVNYIKKYLAILIVSNHYHLQFNLDISYSHQEGIKMTSTRYPQRVRNDLRFRELTVLRVERVAAGFQRIVLGGDALEGFSSRGFDDHSKVFFPEPGATFVRQWLPMKGSTGAKACARRRVTTHRCTMKRVMNWSSISLSMMAALPATGRSGESGRQTHHRRPARFTGGRGRLRLAVIRVR
jgi:hypothetical protein